jgi:hypothetical protein
MSPPKNQNCKVHKQKKSEIDNLEFCHSPQIMKLNIEVEKIERDGSHG